jgi:phenylacetate-CoA ligase
MTNLRPPWKGTHLALADNDRGLDWIRDRRIECATTDELNSIAEAAWTRQRTHVAERSEFYRTKLGTDITDIGLRSLSEVPFTTKSELHSAQQARAPFGSHLAVDPKAVKRVYQTSGSSGRPSLIALTKADIQTWKTIGSRSYFATSLHPHNSVLTTFGAGPFVAGHTHGILEILGARSVPVGPGDTDRVIAAFEAGLVDTLLSTPSFALYLVDRFARDGVDAREFGVIHLILGGEPGGGLPTIRDAIETAFGATVTEAMGLGDVSPSMFGECPAQQGLHFGAAGLVWPELIDTEGNLVPIEAGAEGELVYTHLEREAMPVIRFRSGDYVAIQTTNCPCDRTTFTIRIAGRVDDMFIVRGVNVYPSAVQAVAGEFVPAVTGRIRAVVPESTVSVTPPVPIEVEIPDANSPHHDLATAIAAAIKARLKFRAVVTLVPQSSFGSAEYKTSPVIRRDPKKP